MKTKNSIRENWNKIVLGVSAGVIALAVIVLAGWHAHIRALVQIFDGLIAMQYNTALSFLALGAAGIGLSKQRRWLMLCGGGVAALMGAAVIFEYATGVPIGIDTLFFYPWERALSADPGRMAITTAVCFFLSGGTLAILAVRAESYAVLGIVHSVTLSLALTSMIGYAFQVTYVLPFSLGSQMALHTSAAFLAYGVAMFGHAWLHAERGPDGLPRWCAGIGAALLPVLLVGAGALSPEQTWQAVPAGAFVGIAGVGLFALAIRLLNRERVAYKGALMIAMPLLLLLIFVGLVTKAKHRSESAQVLALHSTEVVGASQSLMEQITEAESAVRGYAITSDETFFNSYKKSAELVAPTLAKLRGLVSDNPKQVASFGRIGILAGEKMERLSDTADLVRDGRKEEFDRRIKEGKGFTVMAKLRAEMEIFLREEERLSAARLQLLDASWQRLSWLLVAGTASAILVAGILMLSFSGGISRRLQRLRDNARSLAAGRELALPLNGHDEIAELDRVFHEMAESLGEANRREKANRIIEGRVIDVRHTEALLKAGALQNAIFNSANFSSIATDAKGVIQIFNVGAERMLGYDAADVLNKITPADISDSAEVIARAKALSLELGTTITPGFEALVFKALRGIEDIYELTYIRKDGSRFPAVVSVTALRDAEDLVIGYLLIGTDNSARKRAEQALLKAGALQNAIFNSANFSSIATDEKGVIQIFNVGAERMLGYAAADVMNKITPADISDPQEVIVRAKALSLELGTAILPGFEALVFKASREIEDIYELTYIRKDGSRFPAVVSVTALRADDGAIIGYLLIGTDNTARKQIEEERKKLDQRLRDQQFYTRSLIEANTDAIMTTDPLGIITDVNKQMEALTACTRDELIGAPFKNYFTDPERAEAGIALMLSGKKIADYELTARARDGRETVVSYNATTFYDRDRKLQGVFAAARDVTERKRFERELQDTNVELESAKSSAEKANLAKTDFLSSMSHELRSPLNAILGFAQLMESATPEPTASQSARIAQILQAGWYLLKLINEILDLAGIESGQVSLSREAVSLSDLMTESHAMMEVQAKQLGIRMTFPKIDRPFFVNADRTRLKQIVINLLSNAIKYNQAQGAVTVDCAESAPGRVRFSVRDTGEGLPPEKLAQLFQPFNRLGQETGSVSGTGIGLVVTKRLAELMGGVIGVESTVGTGSVFWCELNSADAPQFALQSDETEDVAPLQTRADAHLRTLLYVEDNPANLELVEQLIARRKDIQLVTAMNGTLGIELARGTLPTVILMDINLPGVSGFEAMKILREDPATAHIPVVALSANAMPRDVEKGIAAGFFRYLTKPINVREFMETLNTALEFAEKPAAISAPNVPVASAEKTIP